MASTSSTSPDTLVTLKINFDGTNRRFKLPLRDLGASTFADKLRLLLAIPPTSEAIFERYSDSAAAFVTLDSENISVYKQLYRAAKAKQKLRLKATVVHKHPNMPRHAFVEDEALGTTEQVEAHHYPSPPASPPVVQSKHADSWNEEISSPSVAEIRRNLEDLLTSRDASQADASSKSVTADFSAETHGSASSEIPVTYGQAARERFFAELAGINTERRAALRAKCGPPVQQSTYSVYCNSCQNPIPDQHYHCSICDDGDFDLCQACVDDGNLCSGEGHWLIKRFVQNGKVINSTTEILPPKNSIADPKATLESSDVEDEEETRTCNSCIQGIYFFSDKMFNGRANLAIELPERNFVTCTTCSDYDLCIPCHMTGDHGHHPRHAFVPVVGDVQLTAFAKALLQPGRNASHQAICDGCDKARASWYPFTLKANL
ncbi:MAG: hypothetical protein M1818_002639 [Claussenomyces sp. TS43310]|nr:MAG: hypothetical protein M1818_002639 [Claussenomyces sp. TS43310]